jgi:hypothetical protein
MPVDRVQPRPPRRSRGDRESIKDYLKPFRISARWTTFNGAFQAALAVPEPYEPVKAAQALHVLGQPASGPLSCVYCGSPAATWDHLNNIVRNKRYSGFGHRIFNLVPACRTCNESKGSKPWREFLDAVNPPDRDERRSRIDAFAAMAEAEQFSWDEIAREFPDEARRYDLLVQSLRQLLREGDELAGKIRDLVAARLATSTRRGRTG